METFAVYHSSFLLMPIRACVIAILMVWGTPGHAASEIAAQGRSHGLATPDASSLPPAPSSIPVVITSFRALGLPAAAAVQAEASVGRALAAHNSLYRVLSVDDVQHVGDLHATIASLGCDANSGCVAELLRASQATLAVTGSIGQIGSEVVLSLNVLDAQHALVIGQATRGGLDVPSVLAMIPEMVRGLFAMRDAGGNIGSGNADHTKFMESKATAKTRRHSTSYAVLDLRPLGIAPDVAHNLTQIVAAQIRSMEGASVISRDDMNAMIGVERLKQQLGCDDASSCLAEIGGALGVDKLVVGHAGLLGQNYVISLRLIDVRSVTVEQRVTDVFVGQPGELIRAVRQSARRMLGSTVADEQPGMLSISSPQRKARVFVDGVQRGRVPLPPIGNLVADKHSVRLRHAGYQDWYSDVFITPGDTTALWVVMQEKPQHWYQKWWVWTVVGSVLLGGGLGTYFGVRSTSHAGHGQITIQASP